MEEPRADKPTLKGIYGKINVSVKLLDAVIVVGMVAMLIVLFIGLQNRGYTVTFDSRGGTDVASQSRMHEQLLEEPELPTREGYTFTGWYTDANCSVLWNVETDTVQGNMTLYAGWRKNE